MAAAGGGAGEAIRAKLMRLLESNVKTGVRDSKLRAEFPSNYSDLLPVLQELLGQHRLDILQDDATKETIFRLVEEARAQKLEGLGDQDMMVLQAIEKSGNVGVWVRVLKAQTRLQLPQLKKSLKRLESRQLIKQINSIQHKSRKMYMLFDLAPSKEVTGGPWYTDQEFDEPFIRVVRELALQAVGKAPGGCSRTALVREVARAGVSHVQLGEADVQQILNVLKYEDRIQIKADAAPAAGADASNVASAAAAQGVSAATAAREAQDAAALYVRSKPTTTMDALSSVPCGVCEVEDKCTPGGAVSPEGCKLLGQWSKLQW